MTFRFGVANEIDVDKTGGMCHGAFMMLCRLVGFGSGIHWHYWLSFVIRNDYCWTGALCRQRS
jgi:hypothetical protein